MIDGGQAWQVGGLSRKRRDLLGGLALLPLMSAANAWGAQSTDQQGPHLDMAGPPASVSFPLLHMMESGALADFTDKARFTLWTNPDQLRALAMEGKTSFIAAPTNVAANLYNRGVPLTLVNVAVWGILWMVSRSPDMKTLADFKGKEIAIPFRADMPDIIFSFLCEKQGLNLRKDFKLRYVATPMDAVQLLLMRRVDHALLAEPAISMALRKSHSFPVSVVAPELYRSVNLQEEWGRLLDRPPRIPQAGMAALGAARNNPKLLARFEKAYAESTAWCFANPQECGELVARHITMLTPEAVTDSLMFAPQHYATAINARSELEYFYQLLLDREPATVGGKLPDGAFYAGAGA